jgi:hypothetical protein
MVALFERTNISATYHTDNTSVWLSGMLQMSKDCHAWVKGHFLCMHPCSGVRLRHAEVTQNHGFSFLSASRLVSAYCLPLSKVVVLQNPRVVLIDLMKGPIAPRACPSNKCGFPFDVKNGSHPNPIWPAYVLGISFY